MEAGDIMGWLPKHLEIHHACQTSPRSAHTLLRVHAAKRTHCSRLATGAAEPPSRGKELQVQISKRAGAQCHLES